MTTDNNVWISDNEFPATMVDDRYTVEFSSHLGLWSIIDNQTGLIEMEEFNEVRANELCKELNLYSQTDAEYMAIFG